MKNIKSFIINLKRVFKKMLSIIVNKTILKLENDLSF